jgi:hypothetical protein
VTGILSKHTLSVDYVTELHFQNCDNICFPDRSDIILVKTGAGRIELPPGIRTLIGLGSSKLRSPDISMN